MNDKKFSMYTLSVVQLQKIIIEGILLGEHAIDSIGLLILMVVSDWFWWKVVKC